MVEQQRQKLMSELAEAEQERQVAADALAAADNGASAGRPGAARRASCRVRRARGARAHRSAARERARAPRRGGARSIREQLGCAPDGCLDARRAASPAPSCRPLEQVDSQLTRLKADRERLGGVNLQADEELHGAQPAVRRPGQGEGRRRGRHRQAALAASARSTARPHSRLQSRLRHRQRPLPAAVHDAVRRRRGAPRDDRGRGPAGGRPRDHRQAARQEAGDAIAAVGRRAVADRAWR